jgi:hypothetical protein
MAHARPNSGLCFQAKVLKFFIVVPSSNLCTGGADVIRKEAWLFHRTTCGVRLCWEREEPTGPKGLRRPHQVYVLIEEEEETASHHAFRFKVTPHLLGLLHYSRA